MALDYGMCPCSGKYMHRMVEVRMQVNYRPILLKEIPQGACPECGSRIYKTEYLEYIESLMKSTIVERFRTCLREQ